MIHRALDFAETMDAELAQEMKAALFQSLAEFHQADGDVDEVQSAHSRQHWSMVSSESSNSDKASSLSLVAPSDEQMSDIEDEEDLQERGEVQESANLSAEVSCRAHDCGFQGTRNELIRHRRQIHQKRVKLKLHGEDGKGNALDVFPLDLVFELEPFAQKRLWREMNQGFSDAPLLVVTIKALWATPCVATRGAVSTNVRSPSRFFSQPW